MEFHPSFGKVLLYVKNLGNFQNGTTQLKVNFYVEMDLSHLNIGFSNASEPDYKLDIDLHIEVPNRSSEVLTGDIYSKTVDRRGGTCELHFRVILIFSTAVCPYVVIDTVAFVAILLFMIISCITGIVIAIICLRTRMKVS